MDIFVVELCSSTNYVFSRLLSDNSIEDWGIPLRHSLLAWKEYKPGTLIAGLFAIHEHCERLQDSVIELQNAILSTSMRFFLK